MQHVFHFAPLVSDFKFVRERKRTAFAPVRQDGSYSFRVVRDGRGGFHDFVQDTQSSIFLTLVFLLLEFQCLVQFIQCAHYGRFFLLDSFLLTKQLE